MPGGDRTGPRGMGSRTGRAAGFCSGYGRPGHMSAGWAGRARGRGFGGRCRNGRGAGAGCSRRNRYRAAGMPAWAGYGSLPVGFQQPDPEAEKQALKHQADALQAELELINKRLAEMESAPDRQ